MKRSEMLQILQKSLRKHQQDMGCCGDEAEMLSHVLDDLKDAGMLPPIIRGCEFYTQFCTWEPEDDSF